MQLCNVIHIGKDKGHGLQSCSRLSLLTQLYPLTRPVHSCTTISTSWGALHCCHYRCWLNNHHTNHDHMTGTHSATGWICGLFLQVLKTGLDSQVSNLMLHQRSYRGTTCDFVNVAIYMLFHHTCQAFIFDQQCIYLSYHAPDLQNYLLIVSLSITQ